MRDTRAKVEIPSGYRRVTRGKVREGDYLFAVIDQGSLRWTLAPPEAVGYAIKAKTFFCVVRPIPEARGPYGRFD